MSYDWTAFLEVSKDINESQTVGSLTSGTPLKIEKNGIIETYYVVKIVTDIQGF